LVVAGMCMIECLKTQCSVELKKRRLAATNLFDHDATKRVAYEDDRSRSFAKLRVQFSS
jgi:hypothetical protein